MVGIQEVKTHLMGLKSSGAASIVAVFVGGTSGIGESTARELVRYTAKPRIYLVGRNEAQATQLKAEFEQLNPQSEINFIQSDVALLKNVDKVCEEIASREEKVNLLFMSAGIFTFKGRNETPEGLDKKFSLHYYSRLRFVQNLLPLLNKAAAPTTPSSSPPSIARVISILGGGSEAPINTSDLSLKSTFSVLNCQKHSITMTTLAFQTLAKSNPHIGFIHSQPGAVHTGADRSLGPIMKATVRLIYTLGKPWTVSLLESGERHAWAATTEKLKNDVLTINENSEKNTKTSVVSQLTADGTEKLVWDHTNEVFEKICTTKEGKY